MSAQTDTRAEFEAFISARPYELDTQRYPPKARKFAGEYLDENAQLAWEAWQAALAACGVQS